MSVLHLLVVMKVSRGAQRVSAQPPPVASIGDTPVLLAQSQEWPHVAGDHLEFECAIVFPSRSIPSWGTRPFQAEPEVAETEVEP